jgi:hypothetical protein
VALVQITDTSRVPPRSRPVIILVDPVTMTTIPIEDWPIGGTHTAKALARWRHRTTQQVETASPPVK